MLTPQQYEAIGRFALAFNEIEYFLEAYMALFLGTPESGIAAVFAEQGMFWNKVDRFRKVLSAIVEEYPTLARLADAVDKLAKEALNVAKKRNEYMHALAVDDPRTKQAGLRIKRTYAAFNETEVVILIARTEALADELNFASASVLVKLDEQRKLR